MIIFPSPAKINLFLRVFNRNKYGYHNLTTLIQFIDYNDILYFQENKSKKISIYSNIKNIKLENNLIFKSAALIMRIAKSFQLISQKTGISIFAKKFIPLGGGLGGGSSNAATVLLVLNKLWKINFSLKKLSLIGLKIGTDIPFFINGRSSFVEGIGEKLTFIKIPKKWYLIVYPGFNISTEYIFKNFKKNKKIKNSLIINNYKNDFEILVKNHFHFFKKCMSIVSKYAYFRMTGTGSCIFAEFDTKYDAYKILNKLPYGIRSFVAKGMNISPLFNFLNY